MSRLIGAILVRNEAAPGRWLRRVLEQMKALCDGIVVVDDQSDDDGQTLQLCAEYTRDIFYAAGQPLWETDELTLRKYLWERAREAAGPGGWVLNLDADETLENRAVDQGHLWHSLARAKELDADALGFRLHDMWSETHYREDQWWNAHTRVWPMCVRVDAGRDYQWHERPLHCGRFPANAATRVLDTGIRLQHWGWSREEDRAQKYERYCRADPDGRYGIKAQYESILDPQPHLVRWEEREAIAGSSVFGRGAA